MVTTEDILRVVEAADLPVDVSKLEPGVPLANQELDSLDIATLMLAIESKYGKAIPPEIVARLRTLDDIKNFLNG